MKNKYNFDIQDIIKIVPNVKSIRQLLKELKMPILGDYYYNKLKKIIIESKIDISHFSYYYEGANVSILLELVKNSKNYSEVAQKICLPYRIVYDKIKKLNIDISHFNDSKIKSINIKRLKSAVSKVNSFYKLCKELNIPNNKTYNDKLREIIRDNNIDNSHFRFK